MTQGQTQTTAPSLLGLEEDGRDLFGLASHKLNTPLACIRGFVSTLLQRGNDLDRETSEQFLQLVLTQVDRLLNVIDELGTEGVRVQPAGDVDSEVVGDAELVGLALRPLVENGLVYGPRLGMVTVTVTGYAEVTRWEVHDDGSRLTSDALEQLFKPFQRSDEPVERRGSGAGLGLTLTRAYAEVMGGSVGGRVDEHGTAFWIEIPAKPYEGSSGDD
jgi:signal transduction histidine kinase